MTPEAQEEANVQTTAMMHSDQLSNVDMAGEKATHPRQEEVPDKNRDLTVTAPGNTNGSTPRNSLQTHRTDYDRNQRLDKDHGRKAGEGNADSFAGATPSFEVACKDRKSGANHVSITLPEPPKSSYYYGPPPVSTAYGTDPIGTIGLHHAREIIRVERDYEHGELCQFSSAYPLELEGRITPTEFLETVNAINEILISAYSVKAATVDNILAIVTLYLSTLVRTSHYTKEMRRLEDLIQKANIQLYHRRGLHILWPRRVAFLFLEIEYY